MMRLVVCLPALMGFARATRAKDMKDEAFAWPWDRDAHHAVPHHVGGLMAARARVHHGDMFDASSSFDASSTDTDSSSSGGDFMDQYITETGGKPQQVDSDKPKVQKQDDSPSIPDMASMFGDDSKAQSKPQQPWSEERPSSGSSNMDNLFGGSFGFDTPAKATNAFSFDDAAPAKHEKPVDSGSSDDMTNLFGGNQGSSSDSAAAPTEPAAAPPSDSGSSGWPWDTHAKKKDSEEHHGRDLWSSHSDSDTSSGSSSGSSSDMANMFGGSSSGSSDTSSNSHSFSDWSTNDFGGSKAGVSQPAQAPQQQQQDDTPQRSADSPIQGPTQRESSISGASAQDQVVDVRLSSELQQSLLQARSAETRMLQRFRGVSN